jgi:hypothetical protein
VGQLIRGSQGIPDAAQVPLTNVLQNAPGAAGMAQMAQKGIKIGSTVKKGDF